MRVLAACRSRNYEELHDEIGNAYLSASLCHLANISYRRDKAHHRGRPEISGDAAANKLSRATFTASRTWSDAATLSVPTRVPGMVGQAVSPASEFFADPVFKARLPLGSLVQPCDGARGAPRSRSIGPRPCSSVDAEFPPLSRQPADALIEIGHGCR